MKKLMVLLFAAIELTACGSVPVEQADNSTYSAQTDARIRLFGQNGATSTLWTNVDCKTNPSGNKMNVGGGLDGLTSMMGTVSSLSLGIPSTYTTNHIADGDGILSKVFFQEYIIPAGEATIVKTSFLGATPAVTNETAGTRTTYYPATCQSNKMAFIPEAGKDYEVIGINGNCGVAVHEVKSDGSLAPIQLFSPKSCI